MGHTRLGWLQGLLYCVAQLLGGVAAAYVLIAVLPDTGWRFDALRWITPETMPDFSRWNAMLLEGVLTFIVGFRLFCSGRRRWRHRRDIPANRWLRRGPHSGN